MLYLETIDSRTFELLVKLQKLPAFSDLRLVGETALALQIGHRKSIDLDLFGNIKADEFEIAKQLNGVGTVTTLKKSTNINIYLIDGIKVEIVNYPYTWLEESVFENDFFIAGIKDIVAMKLAAITGRGTKKDFIDLYFLLKFFTLKQMLKLYSQKFSDGSEFMVLKSLSYFNDADLDEDPIMLKQENWDSIKKVLSSRLEEYVRNG